MSSDEQNVPPKDLSHDDTSRPREDAPAPLVRTADDAAVEREMRLRSRRAFLIGGAAMVAGYGGWRWLRSRPYVDGTPAPFRDVLGFNESVARRLFFDDAHLAPTFPSRQATMPRYNGDIGLDDDLDPATWRLQVFGIGRASGLVAPGGASTGTPLQITLAEIMALPRYEMVTELKCIEGWSTVVHWTGARFSDLVDRLGGRKLGARLPGYVSLETPGGDYYVGLDLPSALHPQTLLCYGMGGRPLAPEHGAPLRLVTPVKYGIKNIKRIGTIRFTDQRPADYWAQRGYDWYAGL